jgi:hypothetical protein
MGRKERHTGLWLSNPEGKRQLGRPGCKLYFKTSVVEIGSEEGDLILRAQDRRKSRALVDSLI